MSSKQDEKNQQTLRELLMQPGNRKCMDCTAKGPVAACTDFGTFVCQTCSGIHREFGHRIKMISMATFKPEEIDKLKRVGNENARKIWLAKWTQSDFPEPDPSRHKQIREFIHAKYVAKKWYDSSMRDTIMEGKQQQQPQQQQQQPSITLPPPTATATKTTNFFGETVSAPNATATATATATTPAATATSTAGLDFFNTPAAPAVATTTTTTTTAAIQPFSLADKQEEERKKRENIMAQFMTAPTATATAPGFGYSAGNPFMATPAGPVATTYGGMPAGMMMMPGATAATAAGWGTQAPAGAFPGMAMMPTAGVPVAPGVAPTTMMMMPAGATPASFPGMMQPQQQQQQAAMMMVPATGGFPGAAPMANPGWGAFTQPATAAVPAQTTPMTANPFTTGFTTPAAAVQQPTPVSSGNPWGAFTATPTTTPAHEPAAPPKPSPFGGLVDFSSVPSHPQKPATAAPTTQTNSTNLLFF